MVAKTCHRSPRYIKGALGFDPAYRLKLPIRVRSWKSLALSSSTRAVEGLARDQVGKTMDITAEHIECSTGRTGL
jgi:hypothetical protein